MNTLIKCCGGCVVMLWATLITAQSNISRVEYYIDNDPGYGKGKSVIFPADTNLSDISFKINPSGLSNGVHLLGVRAKDADGAWSTDNKWLFAKPYPSTAKPGTVPNVKQVEYYIDKDPGYGKGVPVAVSNANNLADINFAVNISGLAAGDHNLFVRSKDMKDAWSIDNIFAFTVGTSIPGPSIVVSNIVRKKLCFQDSVEVSYEATGRYAADNKFTVELSDATGDFSAPTSIGTYNGTGNTIIKCGLPAGLVAGSGYKIRVSGTNPMVTGLPIADSIKINNLPVPVIIPRDTTVIMQGDSLRLTTTSTYKSYLWSTSAKTSSIQVKKYGAYTVKVTDNNGCSAVSAAVFVNVTPVITASGPVTDLCPGTVVTLSASKANNYLWNTMDTTQSIEASSQQSYYVTINGGGKGNTSEPVTVTYLPCGEPGSLSVTNITTGAATLNWDKVSCAHRYELQYRAYGSDVWNTVGTIDTTTSFTVSDLSAATIYEWHVRAICADEPLIAGNYSVINSFTTSNSEIAGSISMARPGMSTGPVEPGFTAMLYPNPATRNTNLKITGNKLPLTVVVTDITGKVLWTKYKVYGNFNIPVQDLLSGTYLVIIKDSKHQQTLKLVKN